MNKSKFNPAIVGSFLTLLILLNAGLSFGQTILVSSGSTWKYLDNGSDQGTAWRQPSFNDDGWASGPAQLGYGDGDEATVVSYGPDPNNKYVTTYFRHNFNVTNPSQFSAIILKLLRDDGAVAYMNGVEVCRSNMPNGTIYYNTLASSAVSGSDEVTFFEFPIAPSYLVEGANLLAVEIHQANPTSTDISFDLELVGTTEPPSVMRKAPHLLYAGINTEMRALWQLIANDTCLIEWGTDTTYSIGSALTTEYGNDHQHAYTIPNLTPGTKYHYRMTVNSEAFTGSFRSAPPDNASQIKFMVYGDTRTYPAVHNQIAGGIVATYNTDPGFQSIVLSNGDLVTYGDNEADWDNQFFDPSYLNIQTMLANLPYQSTIGNHEMSGQLFVKYFPYPFVGGRYWSFDYGPAHFVMIDQYTNYTPNSPQLQWIENDLASTTKPWKIVCLHEPGWSAGGGHANNTNVQNYIQPLCEQYDVSLVFCGHNHYYARAFVDGVHHITTGGGGAPLHQPNFSYPNVVDTSKTYHFCQVEINGNALHFTAVTSNGVVDSFTTAVNLCCDVEMFPDSYPIIVPPGGSFGVTGIVGNPTQVSTSTTVWVGVKYLNNFYELWNFPDINLNANQYLDAHLDQPIPIYAPAGTYEYVAYCGPKPTKCDSSVLLFTVTGAPRTDGAFTWGNKQNWDNPVVDKMMGDAPVEYFLFDAYPNPFNATTNIQFGLPESGDVDLTIYNLLGQRVVALVNGHKEAGQHSVIWDAAEYSSGIYFYQLTTGEKVFTKRMTLLK